MGFSWSVWDLVDVARISAGVSGGSRQLAARSSLRRDPRWWVVAGRHDGVRQSGRSGQSEGSTSPPRVTEVGVMTCTTRDRPEPWGRRRGLIPPPWAGLQRADVVVAQRVEDVLDCCRAAATAPMLRPRLAATRSRIAPTRLVVGRTWTDSTAAHRTSREPCLVIRPRCTWVSDSWCLGVSPAQHAS